MLESATQDVVNSVLAEHPDKVIALDRLFAGNDQKTEQEACCRNKRKHLKSLIIHFLPANDRHDLEALPFFSSSYLITVQGNHQ